MTCCTAAVSGAGLARFSKSETRSSQGWSFWTLLTRPKATESVFFCNVIFVCSFPFCVNILSRSRPIVGCDKSDDNPHSCTLQTSACPTRPTCCSQQTHPKHHATIYIARSDWWCPDLVNYKLPANTHTHVPSRPRTLGYTQLSRTHQRQPHADTSTRKFPAKQTYGNCRTTSKIKRPSTPQMEHCWLKKHSKHH